MATLVRKKTKTKKQQDLLPSNPLVASGAPYRGNGSHTEEIRTNPIKIHVSAEELMLMENFNDGSSPITPSAPDFDLLNDSKHIEQVDHWETIMMGSPMTPLMDASQTRQIEGFSLTNPPPASTNTQTSKTQLYNGESPSSDASILTENVPTASVSTEKKYTLPPPSVTMASVVDLLIPSTKSKLMTAPVYPVLKQLKPIVITKREQVVVPAHYEEAPLVPLKEVPHVPLQRFENSEVNLELRDTSLHHFEQHLRTIEHTPNDFYRLVEAYLHFEHALRQTHSLITHMAADIDEKRSNVWTIDFDTASVTALCGDLKSIEESVEYQTAELNAEMKAELSIQLERLRQLRTAEASLRLYDRALGFLRIEDHVDKVLEENDTSAIQGCMDILFFFEKNLVSNSRFVGSVPTSIRRGQLILTKDQEKVLVCHACQHPNPATYRVVSCSRCDALCFIPQSTVALSSKEWQASVSQCRLSIQHWLHRCMQKLHGSDVMAWLLMHLLHMPLLALERQWIVSFVQFPAAASWTMDTVDHFLGMMHLLFHPPVLPMQYANDLVATDDEDRPDEWLLIETPAHGELSLTDADYLLLWHQFPLQTALSHCMTLDHGSYSRLLYLVNECTIIFEKFADYDLLVTAISEALGLVLQTAATHPGSLFDQLFQIGLFGVVMARNPKVYSSLPSWCYHSLSPSGKWDALFGLFFQPQLPLDLKSYVPFQCFLSSNPGLRSRFYKEVQRNDALLMALGVLASHTEWSELVQTIVHEIFHCYLATKLLDSHARVLSIVCTAHPASMSQILGMLTQQEDGIPLFPLLPLQVWHPTDADLSIIRAWLMLDNLSDKKAVLARTILDALNWSYRDDGYLAIHPNLHRQVALVLVDATMQHQSNQKWMISFDFRSWSWALMLRLQFYSKQFEPFLPLINLETDLTRDAIILRRYTKSIPQSHILFGKAEHGMDFNSCISYVDETPTISTGSYIDDTFEENEDIIPLAQMEPIVLYAVCQLTTHLFSSSIDKFAPLLSLLLDHGRSQAVLQVVENILLQLSQIQLTQEDVHKFMKNYMEYNNDWRSVVGTLNKNLYFVVDSTKSTLIQECLNDRDGSITLNQILPIVLTALEESLCIHPALIPALLDQLPSTWMQYAVSTFINLNKNNINELKKIIKNQYKKTNYNLLLYWFIIILNIPHWSNSNCYRELIDYILKLIFFYETNKLNEFEIPFHLYLNHLCYIYPTSSLSFVSSIIQSTYKSILFGDKKQNEMYLIFLSLLIEIYKEKELFKALGHIVLKSKLKIKSLDTLRAKGRLATELYVFGIDTSQPTLYGHVDFQFHEWSTLKIFKIASFLISSNHSIDLLLWQIFFSLYFASVGNEYFGFMIMELDTKIRKLLQGKCRQLSNEYSAKIKDNSKKNQELARIYAAMEIWLENPDVSSWLIQVDHLPAHYCSTYLKEILGLSRVLLHTSLVIEMQTKTIWEEIQPFLWLHLCDFIEIEIDMAVDSSVVSIQPTSLTIPTPLPFHFLKYHRFSPEITMENIENYSLGSDVFHDRSTNYCDVLSQLMTLESEFLDHLNGLYRPKHRVIHTSRPCDGTPNEPCKRPSALHLEYTEWTIDSNDFERLDEYRIQCLKFDIWNDNKIHTMMERSLYLDLTSLDIKVLYQILLIDKIINLLKNNSIKLKEIGIKWFHLLLKLDTKENRIFPPFQQILWYSIKILGIHYIKMDTNETNGLLHLMLEDSARICLLGDCFFPNDTRFVEYYCTIMYENKNLNPLDRYQLLNRFDISLWLEKNPILYDRDRLLSIILGEIILNSSIENKILKMHSKMIHLLGIHYLDDHIDKILTTLLGIYDIHYSSDLNNISFYFNNNLNNKNKIIDYSIWQSILNIPIDIWLKSNKIFLLVDRFTQYIIQTRTKSYHLKLKNDSLVLNELEIYPILLWYSNGILKSMCDLILIWFKAQKKSIELWEIIKKIFQSFLMVLYTPGSTIDTTIIIYPWSNNYNTSDACELICNTLDISIKMYLNYSDASIDFIWDFYLNSLLPYAPNYLAKSYYNIFYLIPWNNWLLTEEILNEMKNTLKNENHIIKKRNTSFKYKSILRYHVLLLFHDIIKIVSWDKIIINYLNHQPSHITSTFYIKYHLLYAEIILYQNNELNYLCKKLERPIKIAEMEAICNGVSILLLDPSILCVLPRHDPTTSFYNIFQFLFSFCDIEFNLITGDELNKIKILLNFLFLFLNPKEWKQSYSIYEINLIGFIQASIHIIYKILTFLQNKMELLNNIFKEEHLILLFLDIFKLCNLPIIAQGSSHDIQIISWMELELKMTVPISINAQECTMLSLDKCMEWSLVGWQMLWQFAGMSKSLGAICQAVGSVSILSQLIERHLDQMKLVTWHELKVPELSADELIQISLRQQCWLTLIACAKQQNVMEDDVQRQLEISMRMNEWMEEIAQIPSVSDEGKLIGLTIALLKRQLSMPGVAISFKRDMIARMSKACWLMGDARQISNGLDAVQRAIGFNFMNSFGKLKYQPDFHVAMLSISLFMRVNSRKKGILRLNDDIPLEISKKTMKLIKTMEGMNEKKHVLEWSIQFCKNSKHSLKNIDEYMKILVTELFPNHYWIVEMI